MGKRRILAAILWTLGLALFPFFVFSDVIVIDDKNREIRFDKPVKRIISLAPHITESLFAAGAGTKIVGAVSYSDYPEEAKKIPRVGGYPSADLEKIISLKPDLVIVWPSGNNLNDMDKLSAFGIKVYLSEPHSPEGIAKTIRRFGTLAGTSKIADGAAEAFLKHYQSLKTRYSDKRKIKVFYQIWNQPLLTVNREHLISGIIELCGGVNVFAGLKTLTPTVSVEAVIASAADVIVAGGTAEKNAAWISAWQHWQQLPATRNEHIYFVNPDLLHRVGPRILQGAEELCLLLEQARK